ncbi:hypothetical protein PO909_011295, partial [Leuciscus waleckii]
TVDECRKKWRDLHDVYVRERREVKKRKSGAVASQKHPWRYYHIMSFLLPFISSRPTSGNVEVERGEGRRNEEDGTEVMADEINVQEESRMDSLGRGHDCRGPQQRRRRFEAGSMSSFEQTIVEAIQTSNCPAPAGSEDPDMQFLQILLPALKRLEPKCRCNGVTL